MIFKEFGPNIDVLTIELCNDGNKGSPKHLEILYHKENVRQFANKISPTFIRVSPPFSYESTKVVPWNYSATTHTSGCMEGVEDGLVEAFETNVTHVSGTSRLTLSDHVFALEQLNERINEMVMGSSNSKDITNLSKGKKY